MWWCIQPTRNTATQGDALLLDDDHTMSPLHQWHAVLELKQRDRGAPTPPSTGGDWELLSPAKAGSACGSSAPSDNEEATAADASPVDDIDTNALLLSAADLDAEDDEHTADDVPLGKPKPVDDGLTHLSITWLVSWFSPHVACPSVAHLNDYVQQVRVGDAGRWLDGC